jgi:hypothetical protein
MCSLLLHETHGNICHGNFHIRWEIRPDQCCHTRKPVKLYTLDPQNKGKKEERRKALNHFPRPRKDSNNKKIFLKYPER